MNLKQVKIEIYAPAECLEPLRNKLTNIGACTVGNYDYVISYCKVQGSWRPKEGSNPFDGKINSVSTGEEYKLEIRCPFDIIEKAVMVIKEIHPYEEPVINIIPLLNEEFGIK